MESKAQVQWVLWGAMLLSVALYFFVAQLLPSSDQSDSSPSLVPALGVVALAAVASSFWFRYRFFAQPTPSQRLTALIIALALCEVAALLGLVVRIVENAPEYWMFLLLGLLGIARNCPRPESR
jgi:hypothetical protein